MKKSWIEMVQDYVDARMAVGGCALTIILVIAGVWGFWDGIHRMISEWSEMWPVFAIMITIVVMFVGIGISVSRERFTQVCVGMIVTFSLCTIIAATATVVSFCVGIENCGGWWYGIGMIGMTAAMVGAVIFNIKELSKNL